MQRNKIITNINLKDMNKLKTSVTAISLLSLSLATFSPVYANSNTYGKFEVEGDHKGVNINTQARIGLRASADKSNKDNENKNDDQDNEQRAAKATSSQGLPVGVQHAPGIQKRIEDGKGLPSGLRKWFNRFFGRDTKTAQNVSLNIRNVAVNTGTSTASISWNTNASTTSEVRYGTTTQVNQGTLVVDTSLATNHSVSISGLMPDTNYFFQITSKDVNGNSKTGILMKLTTKPIATSDTKAPAILFTTSVDVSTSSVRLVWVTDEKADSRVWVGRTATIDTSSVSTVSLTELMFVHSVTVSKLASSTEYHYVVGGADAAGNVSTSTVGLFTTTR